MTNISSAARSPLVMERAAIPAEISPNKKAIRNDPEFAWGAREVATVMFGISTDPRVNTARRRRVYHMYKKYRAACLEAIERNRPLPPNPRGWIVMTDTNRIVLSIATYRAFIASQVGEASH